MGENSEFFGHVKEGIRQIQQGLVHLETDSILHVSNDVFNMPISIHCLYHFLRKLPSRLKASLKKVSLRNSYNVDDAKDFLDNAELDMALTLIENHVFNFQLTNTELLFETAIRLVRFATVFLAHFVNVPNKHREKINAVRKQEGDEPISDTEYDAGIDKEGNVIDIRTIGIKNPSGYENYTVIITVESNILRTMEYIRGEPSPNIRFMCPHCGKFHCL